MVKLLSSNFKRADISPKIKEAVFPGNMHICILCPKRETVHTMKTTSVYNRDAQLDYCII